MRGDGARAGEPREGRAGRKRKAPGSESRGRLRFEWRAEQGSAQRLDHGPHGAGDALRLRTLPPDRAEFDLFGGEAIGRGTFEVSSEQDTGLDHDASPRAPS